MVKCSEVLQCSDGTSNKVSNIIRRHIENRKLLLMCILLYHILSYSLGSIFINIWLYFCLIQQFMYFYWKRLCILIVSLCILIVVYVFILLSMYS